MNRVRNKFLEIIKQQEKNYYKTLNDVNSINGVMKKKMDCIDDEDDNPAIIQKPVDILND